MIFVYITCQNKKEAQKIGRALVKGKLAACVNFWPVESIYRWPSSVKATEGKQGKLVKDKEFALIVKTLKRNFDKVKKRIEVLHSYQVPCICAIPISKVSQKYFHWLKGEIK